VGPVKKIRLSESLVDVIKQIIVDQGFSPGDKFYSEHELTSRLQVSRASVREAVRILELGGQLSVKQGKGIFIEAVDPFEAFVDWLKNNDHSLHEHFEVRLIVEPQTARLAALGATADEVAQLEAIHAEFVRNVQGKFTSETIRCDREFHLQLAKAAHNKILYALTRSITTGMLEGWISSFHTPGRMEKTVTEHGAVIAAVKAGDADAATAAMAAHLTNAIRDIQTTSTR